MFEGDRIRKRTAPGEELGSEMRQTYGCMRAARTCTARCQQNFSPHMRSSQHCPLCGCLSGARRSLGLKDRRTRVKRIFSTGQSEKGVSSVTLGGGERHRASGLSTPRVADGSGTLRRFTAEGDGATFLLRSFYPTLGCGGGNCWKEHLLVFGSVIVSVLNCIQEASEEGVFITRRCKSGMRQEEPVQFQKRKSSSPSTTRVTFLMSTPGAFLTLHW